MAELKDHEIELLRRSVALVTPGQPSGLNRETTLQVFAQLQAVMKERNSLRDEIASLRRP